MGVAVTEVGRLPLPQPRYTNPQGALASALRSRGRERRERTSVASQDFRAHSDTGASLTVPGLCLVCPPRLPGWRGKLRTVRKNTGIRLKTISMWRLGRSIIDRRPAFSLRNAEPRQP